MRILDQSALDHAEYLACVTAFRNSLGRHLSETEAYLAKLAGRRKGAHFGWEAALDKSRYGVLIVLERWKELNERFAESLQNTPSAALAETAPARAEAAARGLEAAYFSLDELEEYSEVIVREAVNRLRAVEQMFAEERETASRVSNQFNPESASLSVLGNPGGPHSWERFRRVHDSFLADLNRR